MLTQTLILLSALLLRGCCWSLKWNVVSRVFSVTLISQELIRNSSYVLKKWKRAVWSLAFSQYNSYWTRSAAFRDCQNFEHFVAFTVLVFFCPGRTLNKGSSKDSKQKGYGKPSLNAGGCTLYQTTDSEAQSKHFGQCLHDRHVAQVFARWI